MRLSIIIPAYNVEQYLERCVDSCENQDIPRSDYEIIIIDDGSNDNTLALAQQLAEKYGNIVVLSQENQGQAVARNRGLDIAKGKYVMFVDSDDYLKENKFKNLLENADKLNVDMLGFRCLVENKCGKVIEDKDKGLEYCQKYSGEELALNYFLFGSVCLALYRNDVFKRHELRFKSGFTHEDSEFCFRFFPCLKSVVYIDDFIYFYRYNNSSTDRNKEKAAMQKRIVSDIYIAAEIFSFIKEGNLSSAIIRRYTELANSMTISYIIRTRKHRLIDKRNIENEILRLEKMQVYPIHGRCNSFKSQIFAYLINFRWLLKAFLIFR